MRTRLNGGEVVARHTREHGGGPIRFGDDPAEPCCQADELRCGCGSLLARRVGPSVELKCRRCKRVWSIPLEAT
jgi:hypothetical protein